MSAVGLTGLPAGTRPAQSCVHDLFGFLLAGNLFITYSMDTVNEIIPFVKFLTDQGFEPAVSPISLVSDSLSVTLHTNTHTLPVPWQIDIFDNPIRRMDTTKWMDRFLKDVSLSREWIMVQSAVLCKKKKERKMKQVRCHFAEIGAHYRGHQPEVQGGRGGRWRGWARPAHEVHSQSGGNCHYHQDSCQQLSPKCLCEISPCCGKPLIPTHPPHLLPMCQ